MTVRVFILRVMEGYEVFRREEPFVKIQGEGILDIRLLRQSLNLKFIFDDNTTLTCVDYRHSHDNPGCEVKRQTSSEPHGQKFSAPRLRILVRAKPKR
jgi:hypothetical protein